MKNMPKKDFWTTLKERVRNYQEDPTYDAWDKIAGALPPPAAGIGVSRKMMGIVLLLVLGSIIGIGLLDWSGSNDFDRITKVLKEDSGAALSRPRQSIASGNGSGESPIQNATSSVVSEESESPTTSTKVRKDASSEQRSRNMEEVTSPSNEEKKPKRVIAVSSTEPTSSTIKVEDSQPRGVNVTDEAEKMSVSDAVESNEKVALVNRVPSRNPASTDVSQLSSTKMNGDGAKAETSVSGADESNEKVALVNQVSSRNPTSTDVSQPSSTKMNGDEAKEDSLEKRQERKVFASPAKQKSEKQRKVFRGAFYASLTPSFSFQKIVPANNDGIEVIGFESPGVMHKDRFGLSFDIGYERAITKRLEWYAGLSLYQQNQTLTYRYNSKDEFELESDGNGGFTLVPKVLFRSFDYNIMNTGVAAGLRYTIKNSGLKHKFGAGLQFQKGILSSDEEQSSYNNADAFYLNYQLTYRLEFRVRPKLDLFMQPSFIHAIISDESLDEPFKLKPYRAGVGFGVVYHF